LEKRKISCPFQHSKLWSSTPRASPQTDYTLPVQNLHNGWLYYTGVERFGRCCRTAIWKLAPLQNTLWPPLHWIWSPNNIFSMNKGFQDVRKNSEKKLHSMESSVQTRLLKLVSCKPEDSDFLHDKTRSWCIRQFF
jgi:hypothetical protein